jgi:hypothetical protein
MKAVWYLNQPLDFKRLKQLQGVSSIVFVSMRLSLDVPVQAFCTILLPYLGTPCKTTTNMEQVPAKVGV